MVRDIQIRQLKPDDIDTLCAIPAGLFDNPIDAEQTAAFLSDPLHEIVVAFDGDLAVGFASGTVLLHPDKPPSMFINEVGTRDDWQRRGIATALINALIRIARARGCEGVWLGTESDNTAAVALYRSLGADEEPGIYFGWGNAF